MRKLLRWILGLNECVECGVIAVNWGRSIKLWHPHSSTESYGYLCERCSNDSVAYNDFKRGQLFEMEHPDSHFTWRGKVVPRVVAQDGLKKMSEVMEEANAAKE